MKLQLAFFLFSVAFFCHPYAQPSLVWELTTEPPLTTDHQQRTVFDPEGNLLVLHHFPDEEDGQQNVRLVKLSPAGDLIWAFTYDGPAGLSDEIFDLTPGPDGNIFLAGQTYVLDSLDYDILFAEAHALLLKVSPEGTLLWQRTLAGAPLTLAAGRTVGVDDEGNSYLAGELPDESLGGDPLFVVKYAPDGNLLWQRLYPSSQGSYQTDRARLQVFGDEVQVNANRRFPLGLLTVRYDDNGNLLHAHEEWLDYNPHPRFIDEAGNCYATMPWRYRLAKFDLQGYPQWDFFVPSNLPDNVNADGVESVFVDDQGRVWLTGRHYQALPPDGSANPPQLLTTALTADGQERWRHIFHNGFNNSSGIGAGIWVNAAGQAYVTGTISRTNYLQDDNLVLLRYDGNGHLNWSVSYDNPVRPGAEDAGYALLGDEQGTLYVTGRTDLPGMAGTLLVQKYDMLNAVAFPAARPLALFPNPVTDQLIIYLPEGVEGPFRLVVYDALGRETVLQEVGQGKIVVPCSNWPAGAFTIRLTQKDGGTTWCGQVLKAGTGSR